MHYCSVKNRSEIEKHLKLRHAFVDGWMGVKNYTQEDLNDFAFLDKDLVKDVVELDQTRTSQVELCCACIADKSLATTHCKVVDSFVLCCLVLSCVVLWR